MKIDKNDIIGGIIVVVAVLASSMIAGLSSVDAKTAPPPIPRKPFIVFVTREVSDE